MTAGYFSRPKRGPRPIPRKATTVRYALDIWHKFEALCKQEDVSTGDAQRALLTWYVTERAAGRPVPSLRLEEAILSGPAQPETTKEETAESPKSDPWAAAIEGLRRLLSIDDFALLAPLSLKKIVFTNELETALVWVESYDYGMLLDQRGLRVQLRAALAGATKLENLKLLWVARKKSPPVASPAVEVVPVVVAPVVPVAPVASAPLPVEVPDYPLWLPQRAAHDDSETLPTLGRIYQARRGLASVGYLAEVDQLTRKLSKLIDLEGVAAFYETHLAQRQRDLSPQPEETSAPVEPAREPDLADKVSANLKELYQRSQEASLANKPQEAAKLGQQAALLVAGCEQSVLDDVARRNPMHARLWQGWIESGSRRQAAEDVYKSSNQRRR